MHFRCLWIVIVVLLSYYGWGFCQIQINRYTINPTVVSIQKNYRDWTTVFPAVTVCFTSRVDKESARTYIKKYKEIITKYIALNIYILKLQNVERDRKRRKVFLFLRICESRCADIVQNKYEALLEVRQRSGFWKYKFNGRSVWSRFWYWNTYQFA